MLFSWAERPAADRAAAKALAPRKSLLVAMPLRLPSQTQSHLDGSRQVGLRRDLPECRTGRVVDRRFRSIEVWTVERVECLKAELQLHPLGDGSVLKQ